MKHTAKEQEVYTYLIIALLSSILAVAIIWGL